MITYDPRDVEVMTLVGQIQPLGVVILCALEKMFPEPVKSARLAFMAKVGDTRKTLRPVLEAIEMCGYATHTGSQASETWHITDIGRIIVHGLIAATAASTAPLPSGAQPARPIAPWQAALILPEPDADVGENLSRVSSSSDLIDQSSDLIDQKIEEETGENLRQRDVAAWCQSNGVTGDKREFVLRDRWCTRARLEAWHHSLAQNGPPAGGAWRSKYGSLNYAITCCLHHSEPPAFPATDEIDGESVQEKISLDGDGFSLAGEQRLHAAHQAYLHLTHDPDATPAQLHAARAAWQAIVDEMEQRND